MQINEFLGMLDNVKPRGANQWISSCPCGYNHAHGDKHQSLSILLDGQRIILNCQTGCDYKEICATLGIQPQDLRNDTMEDRRRKFIKWYAGTNSLTFEAAYSYCYGRFNDGLTKVRFRDSSGEKTFRWMHDDKSGTSKSGFTMNHKDCPNRLFVAGDIDTDGVFLVEGEKDALNLHALSGMTVVCSENGATKKGSDHKKKWMPEYNEQLVGKSIFILFDNDIPGREFAEIEATEIASAGKSGSIYVLDITKVWPECPEKGDVSDMIDALGGEETWNRINGLLQMSEEWKPRPQQQPQEAPQQAEESSKQGNTSTEAQAPQSAPQPPKTSLQLFDDFMGKIVSTAYEPLQTGMPALDRLLGGGIMRQSLVILSAAPAAGKTAFAAQLCETMAAHGADVIFFNLEMSREQLFARSLSRIMNRQGHKMTAADVLKGYRWTDKQREFVQIAATEYRSTIAPRMQYNPEGSTAILQSIIDVLDREAERAKNEGRSAPIAVLDYIHLVASEQREEQSEIIKKTVKALKDYAIKNDTFVIAISATNRTANASGTISLDSGRDTSALEYSADVAMSLNFAALHDKEKLTFVDEQGKHHANEEADARNPDHMAYLQNQSPRRMIVQVLKNRMDKVGGKLYLAFDAGSSMFTPIDRHSEPPAQRYGSKYNRYTDTEDDDDMPF